MTAPYFGLIFNQIDNDPLPPILSDFSIGAIVACSDDATSMFPLNTCVAVNSADTTVLTALGTGPLYKAVARINANLADLEVAMQLIIVRVATAYMMDGVTIDPVATTANLIGNSAASTGIYALLQAPQVCNLTPRLIIVPGFTGQTTFAVTAPTIVHAGDNYTHPVVAFNPTGATATATVGSLGTQATGTASIASGGVTGVSITSGGQDYFGSAPAVTFSGGGGTGAAAHAVLSSAGVVSSIVIDTAGTGYTSIPTVTISAPGGGQITAITMTAPGNYAPGVVPTIAITDTQGGTGTGATATITLEQLANPICAALPPICSSLLAHALVGGPGTTKQDAINWRATLNSQRLIPQDDWEIVENIAGTGTEYIDGVCRSLGLAARTDFQHGGYPFHAWANIPVQGALGVKRPDSFSLFDGATDAQELLTAGVGVTVRGDASDTSLDDSGYIAVSVNNAFSNPLYNLYNKTRGYDFINLALAKSLRKRLGSKNITLASIDAVLDDMTAINVQIQSQDDPGIVGFSIGFKASDNTVEGLRAGKFTVFDDTEVPAPILQITVNRGLDRAALVNELAQFAAATSIVTSS